MKPYDFRPLIPQYDAAVAQLVRDNLIAVHLDIPGTAYADPGLDHLSDAYTDPRSAYFVLLDGETVIGGVGLAPCELFPDCCELQKLYLADAAKGQGLGYALMAHIEAEAIRRGYRTAYLETHSRLAAALHLYARCGYTEIPKPPAVVHSAMDRFFRKDLKS